MVLIDRFRRRDRKSNRATGVAQTPKTGHQLEAPKATSLSPPDPSGDRESSRPVRARGATPLQPGRCAPLSPARFGVLLEAINFEQIRVFKTSFISFEYISIVLQNMIDSSESLVSVNFEAGHIMRDRN
jgi:hypothetical protein